MDEKLREMREKAAGGRNEPWIDWAAVRRATAAKGQRTTDDWDLVDAFTD